MRNLRGKGKKDRAAPPQERLNAFREATVQCRKQGKSSREHLSLSVNQLGQPIQNVRQAVSPASRALLLRTRHQMYTAAPAIRHPASVGRIAAADRYSPKPTSGEFPKA